MKSKWGYYAGCDSYVRWCGDPKEAEIFPAREGAERMARAVFPPGEYFIFEVEVTNSYC